MKGDFSKWDFEAQRNFAGTLQQQGRVLLDADWNAQTRITGHWQDNAARDTIGPGVAAVPADDSEAFHVLSANVGATEVVEVTLRPGRVWADGLLTYLDGADEVDLPATYFETPLHDPFSDISEPTAGARDAVILEVWRESVSGFQLPETLIEPALGGPDTTERIQTAMAIRLLRLADEETCHNITDRLSSDRDNRGHLSVSLQEPTTSPDEDCPVDDAGGYTGFEHNLYRIEIAQVDPNEGLFFKWSQFNGGLVGRGLCDLSGSTNPDRRISITANIQAIISSGLTSFYLEVLEPVGPDPTVPEGISHWRVTYGAVVELNGNDLEVAESQPRYLRDTPPMGNVFFRLWNGIEDVTNYASEQVWRDGIALQFDLSQQQVSYLYRPGDYWTFPVRADQANPRILIDHELPQGVLYHRVPLAEVTWTSDDVADDTSIKDCRRVFRPLINQNVCCTVTVGDGISTHGDFDSIQQAIDYLPANGGQVCVLPGDHRGEISIENIHNIVLRGCERQSIVRTIANKNVILISGSSQITIENLDIENLAGIAIDMVDSNGVKVTKNRVVARTYGIYIQRGENVHINNNLIRMLDCQDGEAAIYFDGEQGLIERNDIAVHPAGERYLPPAAGRQPSADPADPCVEPSEFELETLYLYAYLEHVWNVTFPGVLLTHNFVSPGGIEVASGSERVRIIENYIHGGAGNGITLGYGYDKSSLLERLDALTRESYPVVYGLGDSVRVQVMRDGVAEPNYPIELIPVSSMASAHNAITDVNGVGVFNSLIPTEHYILNPMISTDRISITDEATNEENESAGFIALTYELPMDETAKRPDQSAWIDKISIKNNEITGMGLSGIGVPGFPVDTSLPLGWNATTAEHKKALASHTLASLKNASTPNIIDLTIVGNRIYRCLQQPVVAETQINNDVCGQGGIALGACDILTIRDNRIEDNGLNHVHPVCGIFASSVGQGDISDNKIFNNGPWDTRLAGERLTPDIRGGIIILEPALVWRDLNSDQTSIFDFGSQNRDRGLVTSEHAIRVDGNVIQQPVGWAFFCVSAAGTLLVSDNVFQSARSGYWKYSRYWDSQEVESEAEGGTGVVYVENLLDDSYTMFAGNKTRLEINLDNKVVQEIFTESDLVFCNNHSVSMEDTEETLWTNTMLTADTCRAMGNRLTEPPSKSKKEICSLDVLGKNLNTVFGNQVDHCVCAYGGEPLLVKDNISMYEKDDPNCSLVYQKEYIQSLVINYKTYSK